MAEQDIKEERICSCRSQLPPVMQPLEWCCLFTGLPVGPAWNWTGTQLNAAPINKRTKALSIWLSWPELSLCAYHHAPASFAGEFMEHLAIKAENLLLNHVKMYSQTHTYTHGRTLTHNHTHSVLPFLPVSSEPQNFLPFKCVHYHSSAWLQHRHREPWAIHSGFNGDDANPWPMTGTGAKICTPVPQLSPWADLANSKQESTSPEPAFWAYDKGFIHTKLDWNYVLIKNIRSIYSK